MTCMIVDYVTPIYGVVGLFTLGGLTGFWLGYARSAGNELGGA